MQNNTQTILKYRRQKNQQKKKHRLTNLEIKDIKENIETLAYAKIYFFNLHLKEIIPKETKRWRVIVYSN